MRTLPDTVITIEGLLNTAIAAWIPPVYGCTDSTASNYNLLATVNDTSCIFLSSSSDTSRLKIHSLIDSVMNADFYNYDTKDNLNQSMDCAKIISNPNGGFIAVYHHYVNSIPQTFLATSIEKKVALLLGSIFKAVPLTSNIL